MADGPPDRARAEPPGAGSPPPTPSPPGERPTGSPVGCRNSRPRWAIPGGESRPPNRVRHRSGRISPASRSTRAARKRPRGPLARASPIARPSDEVSADSPLRVRVARKPDGSGPRSQCRRRDEPRAPGAKTRLRVAVCPDPGSLILAPSASLLVGGAGRFCRRSTTQSPVRRSALELPPALAPGPSGGPAVLPTVRWLYASRDPRGVVSGKGDDSFSIWREPSRSKAACPCDGAGRRGELDQ